MLYMKLENIIKDTETVESYILFRTIEDWCMDNVPRDRWRFCHSSHLCVLGVDIPGRIIFKCKEDLAAFKLRFGAT
jgi:hypothetical protein